MPESAHTAATAATKAFFILSSLTLALLYRAGAPGQAVVAAIGVASYDRHAVLEELMRIAIAGLGTIGRVLARNLADGMPGLTLACVAARDEEKARGWPDEEGSGGAAGPREEFPEHADLAVEGAPASVREQICRPMLSAGK